MHPNEREYGEDLLGFAVLSLAPFAFSCGKNSLSAFYLTAPTDFLPLATGLPGQTGTITFLEANAAAGARSIYRVGVQRWLGLETPQVHLHASPLMHHVREQQRRHERALWVYRACLGYTVLATLLWLLPHKGIRCLEFPSV